LEITTFISAADLAQDSESPRFPFVILISRHSEADPVCHLVHRARLVAMALVVPLVFPKGNMAQIGAMLPVVAVVVFGPVGFFVGSRGKN